MPTLKQEIIYFNDAFGKIRPNCQMFFYEAGTTTQKNTYTQPDLLPANTNPWPLVSDGAGVFPPIFLESGGYRIIVKDKDGVTFIDRDDINVAETTILSTSDFYFEDLTNAKLGASINGETINLQVGQVVSTVNKNTAYDGLGATWLVVAGGTGTADDDLYADLDNGLQLKKIRNQVPWTLNSYTATGADTIALTRKAENPVNIAYAEGQHYFWVASGTNTGAVTVNVDSLGAKTLKHPNGDALAAGDIVLGQSLEAEYDGTDMVLVSGYSRKESFLQYSLSTLFSGSSAAVDLSALPGGYPGDGFYKVTLDSGTTSSLIHIVEAVNSDATGRITFTGTNPNGTIEIYVVRYIPPNISGSRLQITNAGKSLFVSNVTKIEKISPSQTGV